MQKRTKIPLSTILQVAVAAMLSLLAANSASADTLLGSNGAAISISLKNADLPSNDLIYVQNGQAKMLSPSEAWSLKQGPRHVDLSTLNPDPTTDFWPGIDTSRAGTHADNALPIKNGDETKYLGTLNYLPKFYGINILTNLNSQPRTMTLALGRTLHTMLLRKELLRRLGYKVPAMKYISQLKIRFPNALTRHTVLTSEIPYLVSSNAQRWCLASQKALDAEKALAANPGVILPCQLAPASAGLNDDLEVIFQDVVVMDSTDKYFNLAVAAPVNSDTGFLDPSQSRELRSLVVPFGLLDIGESINQVDWAAAQIDSDNITLHVPDTAIFNCSLDDAKWALNRILRLTRNDFASIVANSYFPEPVTRVLIEKLIARRNSLLTIFAVSGNKLPFDVNVSEPPTLLSGKIMQQDWPGYGSRYAFGDQESPLAHLKYYFLSILESNALDNLISLANRSLPQTTLAQQIKAHNNDNIQKLIEQYLKTGKIQKQPMGLWHAFHGGAGLNISREVIAGPYLGTNNMLQLSDTYGYFAKVGLHVGYDGLPAKTPLSAEITGSVNYTYTHIKPITDLKQSVTEPIKTLYIPSLFKNMQAVFAKARSEKQKSGLSDEDLQKAVTDDMNQLTQFLAPEESLIITQSLSGDQAFNANLYVTTNPTTGINAGLTVDPNELVISRLHFYRKDATTIQVFKDNASVEGLGLSFSLGVGITPATYPIFSVNANRTTGAGTSQIYTLNIDPTLNQNAQFFDTANALSVAINDGSMELLGSIQKPAKLKINFTDKDRDIRFLFLEARSLKTDGQIHIENTDGDAEDFIALSDGKQSGHNFQTPVVDAAKYIVERLTKSSNYDVGANTAANPGQTFLGKSNTRDVTLQARNDSGVVADASVKIGYRWEGWQIKPADLKDLISTLNKKFGYQLYPDTVLQDATRVQLYDLTMNVQVYQSGIQAVAGISSDAELKFYDETAAELCQNDAGNHMPRSARCYNLIDFHRAYKAYHASPDPVARAKSEMTMISQLENLLSFSDFVQFVGGPKNLYVTSQINGFRVGSETLSDPINGSSYGEQDPNNPDGVLTSAENILGIKAGEGYFQWIRSIL